jgi:hypothetical protein
MLSFIVSFLFSSSPYFLIYILFHPSSPSTNSLLAQYYLHQNNILMAQYLVLTTLITLSPHHTILPVLSPHLSITSCPYHITPHRTLFTSLVRSLDPTDPLSSSTASKRKLSKREKINACSVLIISLLRFYSRDEHQDKAQATYVLLSKRFC